MSLELLIDTILVTGAIILAGLSLSVRQLFTAIVLYISLGLLVTVIWVRLHAWDVAIAEAAIGAGLTGALFLVAWRRLSATSELGIQEPSAERIESQNIESPSALGIKNPSASEVKGAKDVS